MNFTQTQKILIALTLGIVIGLLGGPVQIIILWAIAGALLGITASSLKQMIVLGILYGFCVLFFFMISGYAGSEPLVSRLPAFALLGLCGSIGGIGAAALGYVGRRIRRKAKS